MNAIINCADFKWCNGCCDFIHRNGFTKKSNTKDGLQFRCRKCMRAAYLKRVAAKQAAA